MGAKTSKFILTAEQVSYVRNLLPLLKAVQEYPYKNRKTALFFDACDTFLNAISDRVPAEDIRYYAKMVDMSFDKWQHEAFGCAIIPAKYHMLQRADYAWPSIAGSSVTGSSVTGSSVTGSSIATTLKFTKTS